MKEKQYSTDGFQKAGLSFVDSNDMPLQMRVENSAREEAKKVLTERREKDCRLVSMRHAVAVVKEVGLILHYGNTVALQRGLGRKASCPRRTEKGN